MMASKTDGAIVRSLDDLSTKFVSSRMHTFSHLESIEIFTIRDNVNLVDVLKAMEASSEALPSEKDPAAIKAYFGKVYPDMDFDRVYASDMKKMVKWFSVIKKNNIEIKVREEETDETEATTENTVAETATAHTVEEAEAPKKKTSKKKVTEE